MNYRVLAALCCTILFYFSSCKKNDTVISNPSGSDRSYLNSLFAPFRTTPQTLTVTAGMYAEVTGAKGTKLTFYPNSFKDARATSSPVAPSAYN